MIIDLYECKMVLCCITKMIKIQNTNNNNVNHKNNNHAITVTL